MERELIAVRKENLCLIPEGVDDVSAAGIPVAYLTAQSALTVAGFQAGKTVLAPAIGGSVADGIVKRDHKKTIPPCVYGRILGPVVQMMCNWGRSHLKRLSARPSVR